MIVFSSGAALYRVSAAGGTPEPIRKAEPGRSLWHGWPSFLPDGRRFVFTTLRPGNDESALVTSVASATGPFEPREVLTGGVGAFAWQGRLVYGAGGRLQSVAFDERRLETRGEPVPLAEGLIFSWRGGYLPAAGSRAGPLAVYSQDDPGFGGGSAAYRTMTGNVVVAVLFNIIGMLLAALGLITPLYAIGFMILSIFAILLNTLRIRRIPLAHEAEAEENVHLAEVEFLIPKMVCEGCAQTISERLRPISGVREVKSKVAQKHVVVRYEPARVKEPQLKKALDDAGYTALEA